MKMKLILALMLICAHAHGQKIIDGSMSTFDAGSGLNRARGRVQGQTFIHKFGEAPDFDTGDGEVTIWDGANDGTIDAMVYTYSTTNDIDSVISSSVSDVGDVEIQGLDTDYVLTNQTVTLTGQTRVAIPTPLRRVFRMKNVGSTNFVGNVCTYITNAPTTSGDVDLATDVRSCVNNGNNQTLMAIYTIPAGKTGYLRSFFASTSGGSRSTNYKIKLLARPLGQVFQLKHVASLVDSGTSHFNHEYVEPEVFAEKTDIHMTAETTESAISASAVACGFDIVIVDN